MSKSFIETVKEQMLSIALSDDASGEISKNLVNIRDAIRARLNTICSERSVINRKVMLLDSLRVGSENSTQLQKQVETLEIEHAELREVLSDVVSTISKLK